MPDLAALAAIHAASFTHPRPWSMAEIGALLDSKLVFVLTESTGFVMGRAIAGEAELLTLAVLPSARRQGAGHRLVQGFLAEAQARKAQIAFLEVAASNHAALRLYERCGFAPVGRRKGYYTTPDGHGDDALVMSRAV